MLYIVKVIILLLLLYYSYYVLDSPLPKKKHVCQWMSRVPTSRRQPGHGSTQRQRLWRAGGRSTAQLRTTQEPRSPDGVGGFYPWIPWMCIYIYSNAVWILYNEFERWV